MAQNNMRNSEGYWDPTAGTAIRSASTPQVKRGDICYIEIPYSTGHEMEKDRPGIIVSCNELNGTSPCVNVVLCSGSASKRELPEHITIRSTPVKSVAMCEHICTVDKSRVGKIVGHCTQAEMLAVDIGIMSGLGLGAYDLASRKEDDSSPEMTVTTIDAAGPSLDLVRAETERDTYRTLYEKLLDRMTGKVSA